MTRSALIVRRALVSGASVLTVASLAACGSTPAPWSGAQGPAVPTPVTASDAAASTAPSSTPSAAGSTAARKARPTATAAASATTTAPSPAPSASPAPGPQDLTPRVGAPVAPAGGATTPAPGPTTAAPATSAPAPAPSSARQAPAPAPAPAHRAPAGQTAGSPPTSLPTPRVTRRINGDIRITQPGTVLDGVEVLGRISVRAPDVTIRNSIVRGPRRNGEMAAMIQAYYRMPNLRIENVLIKETTPDPYNNAGVAGSNFTMKRVQVVGMVDSVQIHGDNVLIEDSILRDTRHYASHPEQGGRATHNDNVQIIAGKNVTIRRTRMTGAQTHAFLAAPEHGPVNLLMENNYLDHGQCTAKVAPYTTGFPGGGTIRNNVFGPHRTSHATCVMIWVRGFDGSFNNNLLEGQSRPFPLTMG